MCHFGLFGWFCCLVLQQEVNPVHRALVCSTEGTVMHRLPGAEAGEKHPLSPFTLISPGTTLYLTERDQVVLLFQNDRRLTLRGQQNWQQPELAPADAVPVTSGLFERMIPWPKKQRDLLQFGSRDDGGLGFLIHPNKSPVTQLRPTLVLRGLDPDKDLIVVDMRRGYEARIRVRDLERSTALPGLGELYFFTYPESFPDLEPGTRFVFDLEMAASSGSYTPLCQVVMDVVLLDEGERSLNDEQPIDTIERLRIGKWNNGVLYETLALWHRAPSAVHAFWVGEALFEMNFPGMARVLMEALLQGEALPRLFRPSAHQHLAQIAAFENRAEASKNHQNRAETLYRNLGLISVQTYSE